MFVRLACQHTFLHLELQAAVVSKHLWILSKGIATGHQRRFRHHDRCLVQQLRLFLHVGRGADFFLHRVGLVVFLVLEERVL